MKNLKFLAILAFLCACASSLWAAQSTLTTYYPAPSGQYETVQLTMNMLATEVCDSEYSAGTLFLDSDGSLQVCMGGTAVSHSWRLIESPPAPDTDVWTAPSDVYSIYFSKQVGINSDIVFYLNNVPKLYAGVTQGNTSVLSFLGPNASAASSFIAVDNTTTNVGIGTNAPEARLHVVGDIKSSGSITADQSVLAVNGGFYLNTVDVATDPSIVKDADNAMLITGGEVVASGRKTVRIVNYLETSGDMNVTGSLGIGLTAGTFPASTLEVNGIALAQTPGADDPDNAAVTKQYIADNAAACFNRYCNYSSPQAGTCAVSCPAAYPQLFDGMTAVKDEFVTDHYTDPSYGDSTVHVISIVCCR